MELDSISISHRKPSNPTIATLNLCHSGLHITRPATGVPPKSSSARGAVNGFSKKSRARLRHMLLFVDFDSLGSADKTAKSSRGWFVTLTYPREYDTDWHEWKRHLDRFSKRIRRLGSFDWAIWKLELQRRGAPHFHIVVAFEVAANKTDFRAWTMNAWHECIRTHDTQHAHVGTDARPLYTEQHGKVLNYIVKYIGKPSVYDGEVKIGRCWGKWGNLQSDPIATFKFVYQTDWYEFVRRVRRWGKRSNYLSKLRGLHGVTIVGRGWDIFALTRGLELDITTPVRKDKK